MMSPGAPRRSSLTTEARLTADVRAEHAHLACARRTLPIADAQPTNSVSPASAAVSDVPAGRDRGLGADRDRVGAERERAGDRDRDARLDDDLVGDDGDVRQAPTTERPGVGEDQPADGDDLLVADAA
jgi:hypothetical protein